MCSFLDLLNIFNTMFDFKYLCLGLFFRHIFLFFDCAEINKRAELLN